MGPSPERGLDCAIHNFGHRTESAMVQVYGNWEASNPIHNNWEKYTLVKAQAPAFSYSGCGSTEWPPNAVGNYDYGNSSTVSTNCDDFTYYPNLHDPQTVLTPVTCAAWSCTEIGFHAYRFSRMPHNPGCGSDNVLADWWPYIVTPSAALDPSADCPYPPEVTIAGRVTAGDGTPVQDATIGVSGPLTASTTTGRDGRYVFSDLPDGTYTVTADKSGFTALPPSTVTVPPNTYGMDFVLRHSRLTVQEVDFSPTTVYAGGLLQVEVVVQNTGDEMAQTQVRARRSLTPKATRSIPWATRRFRESGASA